MPSTDEVSITFKVSGGTQFNVSVPRTKSIKEIKEQISELSKIPISQQRLIYKGRILKDNDILDDMKVESGHTMHLVRSGAQMEQNKPQNSTSQAANNNFSNSNQSSNISSFETNPNTGVNTTANDPITSMVENLLNNSDFGLQAQTLRNNAQGNNQFSGIPNPNNSGAIPDFSSLMNSPIFQQSINELANNPQLVRNLLNSNPMFAQLSANNPMVEQMLNNPEMLRMMLNPQMIQTVLSSGNMNTPGMNNNPLLTQNIPNFSQLGGILNDQNIASMMSGMINGANAGNNSNVPPAQLYMTQLNQLRDMGFIDTDASLSALQETGGDINAAINKLLERGIGQ
ncbi:Ubiquitin family protein [Cryptosporidium felis]|nr:Ubiquitin family protein [Cryptosporidium felis]